MLKGIPDILSPDLLKILMEMGHTDELVIADGNFPAGAHPQRVVRLDGHSVPELLDAILTFYPLDRYVDAPVTLMAVLPGDPVVPVIWDKYKAIIARHERNIRCKEIGKYEFYESSHRAYALVATSERALYANIILKKGVVIKDHENG
jgi:L-fucose mutarotase